MPSRASPALAHWRSASRTEIGHLLDAHLIVLALGPAGAPAAEQVLHAVVVQLAGRFQRYCRDLHDAAVDALVAAAPDAYRRLLKTTLEADRRLDRQNATSAVLESDFRRFDLRLWGALGDPAAEARRTLDDVNAVRNAIAHQDAQKLDGLCVDLAAVRRWWTVLDELATAIEGVVGHRIAEVTEHFPWSTQ